MNLSEHISNLLFENNQVIIPGFGGFVCVKANATIHPVEHKFTPPSKEITFDQNLKENDNLLINYITQTENITESDAKKLISEFVLKTQNELKEGKKVQIKEIGFLFIDINGKIKLDFDKKFNYLIDSYGLSSFDSPAIQRKEVKEKMIEEAAAKIIVKKSKAGIWISIAAVVIIMVVLGIFKRDFITEYIATFNKHTEIEEIKSDTTKQTIVETEVVPDTIETIDTTEIDSVTEIIPDEIQNEPIEIAEEPQSENQSVKTKNYYIVAGCFSSLTKSEKYLNKLKDEGFEASIQGQTPKGLYRVCFDGYESQSEASKALNKLISGGKYNGWILKIK
ncbi:MAG: SPOR domain-containing protein [Saprospiraceae bacterium]|nr:SPOR domain-containing protein [Saprospiraceae bacterium]